MPDGSSRFSIRTGSRLYHYMGTSTFANFTVLPEIALAKVREDAPFDKICYIGCGVTTGIGAVMYTAKVEAGDPMSSSSAWAASASTSFKGARLVGADMIVGVDINPDSKADDGRKIRDDPLRQPEARSRATWCPIWWISPSGGADYSLRMRRQRHPDASRRWSAAIRAGASASSSVSPGPARKSRPDPSNWSPVGFGEATAFGGARGRTDVPKIVDWYMEGKINIDDLITHVMPLEQINDAFDLMHEGKSIRSVVTF